MEISSIPPGFEFALKRMDDNRVSRSYPKSANCSDAQNIQLETKNDCNGDLKTVRPRRNRRSVKYKELCSSSDDESDSEQVVFSRNCLPKGVIRGCEACTNCQKVTAKWNPEEARRPNLEDAPVFYPSEEEFEDTLKYMESIRSEAEKYGICRIVPPPSWKPPCPLKEKSKWDRAEFSTRIQRIDKLQNRDSMRKKLQVNHSRRRKKRRCLKSGVDHEDNVSKIKPSGEAEYCEAESFGFEPGPDFNMDAFQRYADDFKAQYFRKNNDSLNSGVDRTMLEEQWPPSVEDIEGEYWRMVEKPTEEIEVLYGADVETGAFGSGFPKNSQEVASASDMKYINSGWNLNNYPRLPGSVLSFESSDISGVVVPWLYIGMCFSSFCWHVEDHFLYSLNFMHLGAPKIWYGVPGSDALKLEAAMRKHLPDLFEEQPDLLHKLVTQLSPSILKAEGVPVYRCVQNPGEFVLTFPRAYHAGFNCGFNCAEAVNVAPVDWLPHGLTAIELYREQGRQTSISHDKLLLGAAREAVKANWEYNLVRRYNSNNLRWKEVCGKNGILSKTFKARVEMERMRRESLSISSHQALKMENSFDATSERECSVCRFDLHLSAVGCRHCSPNKYACLNHAKQLCSCSWGAKFFLFRYDICELNILVEALEGKLSAVYRWARFDLGLALSSYVSKGNTQVPEPKNQLSNTSQGSATKEMSSQPNVISSKEANLTEHIDSNHLSQTVKPPVVVLALESVKASSHFRPQKVESAKNFLPFSKENSSQPATRYKTPSCQVSQVNIPIATSLENLASERSQAKQSSFPENKGVILLSDDEGDESTKELSIIKGASKKHASSILKPVCTKNPASTANDSSAMLGINNNGPVTVCAKVEDHAVAERCTGANPLSITDADFSEDVPKNNESHQFNEANGDCGPRPQQTVNKRSTGEDGHKKLDLDTELRPMEDRITGPNPSNHQNNLDRYYRQKGPRLAKVVRRINCNVEPLAFGSVHAGEFWCDSRAIYPKGFRSRVKYIDVVDPTNMCYYVSEILDAGRDRPLFMVSVEHSPNEVFIHLSAGRCWEMVRERVNHEIAKQHKLGRQKLPPLQPPGSVDGMEMFGFSSPAIMQVIQYMDQNQICTEYWKSWPVQVPRQSQSVDSSSTNGNLKTELLTDHPATERILSGLFKKASPEELNTIYSLLDNKNLTEERGLLTCILNEEIQKRST